MTVRLEFGIEGAQADRSDTVIVAVERVVIAGWTGRDSKAVEHHIEELAAIGVPRPSQVPCYYHVAAQTLTMDRVIEVPGERSSGEAEVVLIGTGHGMLVTLGSDHTDRKVESYSITVAKQMCGKPLATRAWRYEEVAEHWDALELRSWTVAGEDRRLYQEGTLAAIRLPEELIAGWTGGARVLPAGVAMFCGTLPAIGGVASHPRLELALDDPVAGKRIEMAYDTVSLPTEA